MNKKNISNRQKVLKGISSQTIVTLVLGFVEIVSFSIMSRLLTKEDFGYYAAIMAIVTVFASFSETGIGSAIIQRKNINQIFIDNAFTLSLLFGLSISLLLLAFSPILADMVSDSSMTPALMIMSVTLLAHCLTSVFISLMQRKLEFLRIGAIHLFSLIATTMIAIGLAYKGFGYYAIITKAVMQSFITCIIAFFFCRTKFSFFLDKTTTISIFRFSGWLMASVVFRNLAHQVDRLLMPRLLSITALGAYNRPQDFINQISTKLNGIFDMALFPVLSSIQNEKEKLKKAFSESLYIMNLFAMLLTTAFAINSELIVRVFFGEKWLDLTGVTFVLSLMLIFNIDGRLADCYLRSMGLTKAQFFFRILETFIKILGLLIGYKWGIMGCAVSIVATNSISKVIKITYITSIIGINILDTANIILKSWKFTLYLAPLCGFAYLLLPHSFMGNIMLAGIFSSAVSWEFLRVPSLVGTKYKEFLFPMIKKKFSR